MDLFTAENLVVGGGLFVLLPLVLLWSSRDALRVWHVLLLAALALVCAAVAAYALAWGRAESPGWGKLVPGFILLGAGALSALFLSSALIGALLILFRDNDAVRDRADRRRFSGMPRKSSIQQNYREAQEGRFMVALIGADALAVTAIVRTLSSDSVTNYLRLLGLHRGAQVPVELSFGSTPGAYMVQLLLLVLIAVVFSTWAVVEYLRRYR